jgi:hypothetical protein
MKRRAFFGHIGSAMTLPLLAANAAIDPAVPRPASPQPDRAVIFPVVVWLLDADGNRFGRTATDLFPRRVTWLFDRRETITGAEWERDGIVVPATSPFQTVHVLPGDTYTLTWTLDNEREAFVAAKRLIERQRP